MKPNVRTLLAACMAGAMMASQAAAEKRVGGVLHGDNQWDLEESPFIVESDVVVTRFAHLTIDPGVRVIIAEGKGIDTAVPQFDALDSTSISIKVEGALTCVGKKFARISFVPARTARSVLEKSGAEGEGNLGWYGIIFNKVNGKFNEIAFTDITGAYNGVTAAQCNPLVRTTVFEQNNIGVNCLKNGSLLVYNCIFTRNFGSGVRVQEANPHIANSLIIFNRGNGLWCDGVSKVRFEYNCVTGNGDGNFLDCDPVLGRLTKVNKRKDSVDYAGNLYADPVFYGSIADSVAFAHDIKLPTDKSKVNNLKIAEAINKRLRDSSFAKYCKKKRPRFSLSRYSPCIGAGDPGRRFLNANGSRNDIGLYGGPEYLDRGKE